MVKNTSLTVLILMTLGTFAWSRVSAAASSGITYQGRILKPDGSPLSGQYTQFKLQIRAPDTNNCLMYEELQVLDMRTSSGVFALTINDGSGTRTDASGYGLDRIFGNRGTFTFAPSTCASGNDYSPSSSDGRQLAVLFKDETMGSWEPIPAQKINYVPFAFEAKQIGGFGLSALVRVAEADGSPSLTPPSPLSNAQYAKLLTLANAPTMTSGQVLGWNGTTWTSVDPSAGIQAFAKTALPTCAAGSYLRNNAGSLECTTPAGGGGGAGTVTRVDTGTGLTGGGFTTTGTISIAAGGVTATELAADAVTTAKILDATVTSAKLATDAVTTAKILDANVTTTKIANGAVTAAKLSPTVGTNGQVLSVDGSGNLLWSTPATYTSTQWTTQAPGINYMSGNVGIGTTSPQGKLEVSGSILMTGATSGYTGFQAPATAGSLIYTLPATAPSNGQVLSSTAAGVLSWQNASAGSITSLTGEVTASGTGAVAATITNDAVTTAKINARAVTYAKIQDVSATSRLLGRYTTGAGVIEEISVGTGLALSAGGVLSNSVTDTDTFAALPCGDGYLPFRASGAWTCKIVDTASTNNAIVTRDGTGNFAANVATVNGLALNNAGSIVNIVNPAGAGYTLTLPTGTGTSNQILKTNGSGLLAWVDQTSSPWNVVAPGINYTAGNVGIGTTSPGSALEIRKTTANLDGIYVRNLSSAATAGGYFGMANDTAKNIYLANTSSGYPSNSGAWTTDAAVFGSDATAGLSVATEAAAPLRFFTGGTAAANERMRILSSGNVGIGTSSPAHPLTVEGANSVVYASSSSSYSMPSYGASSNTSAKLEISNTDGTLGTGAFLLFNSKASSIIQRSYIGGIGGSSYSSHIVFGSRTGSTDYQEFMRIKGDGNVGIGTTTPSEKLEVNGSVKATSFITSSDRRLKSDIRSVEGWDAIRRMRGVRYVLNATGNKELGVIAQEVEAVFPEAVVTDPSSGLKAVKYQSLISPLIEAVKETHELCEERSRVHSKLELENSALKTSYHSLKQEIKELRGMIETLKATQAQRNK